MKLSLKLSRSPSLSPSSSSPPSPSSSSSPTSSPKKPRFPLAQYLGRNRTKQQNPSSTEIVALPSPSMTIPTSPPSRLRTPGGKPSLVSTPSTSHSATKHSSALADDPPRLGKAKVSEQGMHEIKQVFAQFDANGDGKISAEELRAVLRLLGDDTTSEEAEMMVREVDADGDGYIDLKEFVDLNTECLRDAVVEEEMAAAFAVFDLDKNGRITAEELQQVLSRLGGGASTSHHASSVEDCKRMIRGVDRKGTGHVDFDDFKRMMTPFTF